MILFSSNPHGFLAALAYLKKFKSKKKIVITPGIIELGPASKKIHQKIGKEMEKVADLVILVNDNFTEEIKKGTKDKNKVVVENRTEKILAMIKEVLPNVVVLLEGRLPAKIIKALKIEASAFN